MSKFIKTLIVGAASGAAAAYFIGTEKGREVADKVKASISDYQNDPENYHQKAKDKVVEYKELATTTFEEYKSKWESGELTTDNLNQVVKDTLTQVKGKVSETMTTDTAIVDKIISEESALEKDIIIDLTDSDFTEEDAEL